MKTADLIHILAQDGPHRRTSVRRRMIVALLIGAPVMLALFVVVLGMRPDLGMALLTWRFFLKLAIVTTAFAVALWGCAQLATPVAGIRDVWAWLAVPPGLLALGVGAELYNLPADRWLAEMIGSNAIFCLVSIPLLSVVSLAALLVALRAGAPGSPSLSGAMAGLLAGTLSAMLYATHCPDDSPFFVAVWYVLAIAIVAVAGAISGARVLRW